MLVDNLSLSYFAEQLFVPYLFHAEVTEIAINRPGEMWYEKQGVWSKQEKPDITNHLLKCFAVALASFNNNSIDEATPILSGSLETGERVQIVVPPAVENNTISVTLRKPFSKVMEHDAYIESGFYKKVTTEETHNLNEEYLLKLFEQKRIAEFMQISVALEKTIIVAGATGSGKTSYMKMLVEYISLDSRLITIEDTSELKFTKHQNYVHLFYPSESGNDPSAIITSASLLKACFRMKPTRILLSEVRGGETWDFLKIVHSGHSGSMTSMHAGSVDEAIHGLITRCYQNRECQNLSYQVIKEMVLGSVDIICHISNNPNGRFLNEIYYKGAIQQEVIV